MSDSLASHLLQVWLFGAKMGPLNDSMVHIGFNKPELFRVLLVVLAERTQVDEEAREALRRRW